MLVKIDKVLKLFSETVVQRRSSTPLMLKQLNSKLSTAFPLSPGRLLTLCIGASRESFLFLFSLLPFRTQMYFFFYNSTFFLVFLALIGYKEIR